METVGSVGMWAGFAAVVVAMLAIDLFVVGGGKRHRVSMREAATWSVVWVGVALAFAGVLWWHLDGTAGRYAEIDIQLFTDSAKDVEIFLLNSRIDYQHSTPRSERAEAVLTLDSDDATVNLIVYPLNDERVIFKKRNGQPRARARVDAVRKMLAESGDAP